MMSQKKIVLLTLCVWQLSAPLFAQENTLSPMSPLVTGAIAATAFVSIPQISRVIRGKDRPINPHSYDAIKIDAGNFLEVFFMGFLFDGNTLSHKYLGVLTGCGLLANTYIEDGSIGGESDEKRMCKPWWQKTLKYSYQWWLPAVVTYSVSRKKNNNGISSATGIAVAATAFGMLPPAAFVLGAAALDSKNLPPRVCPYSQLKKNERVIGALYSDDERLRGREVQTACALFALGTLAGSALADTYKWSPTNILLSSVALGSLGLAAHKSDSGWWVGLYPMAASLALIGSCKLLADLSQ